MNSALRKLAALWSQHGFSWQRLRARRLNGLRWAGIEVQDTQLHLVVVAAPLPGAQARVLECASVELDGELSAATLSDLAKSLRSRPQRWSLLLPRDDYRVSIIPAPDVPADELVPSVRWQLAPLLDFPVEDAAIDCMRIPTEPWDLARPSALYAIAARGDKVAARASLFREAGLQLSAIDIHETAQRNIATLAGEPDELLVMVAFARQEVHITFNWHGELYLDRLIAEQHGDDDSPARRALLCERIAAQLQRSLEAVRSSYPFMHAARIVEIGAPEGFCAQLATLVSDPVETFQPEAVFDLAATPELAAPANFIRYFPALGTALRGLSAQERG